MKTVLILGSDFSPSSLPPATRIRFFAKHLPKFGWQPLVLTTEPRFYEWPIDPENGGLLAPSLEVIRTKALSTRWTRKVGVGDIGMRTLWYHWQAIKSLCRVRRIDLIFIPVPPSVPMVLGRLAYRKFGIPYVIDYIDPWVTDSYKKLPRSQRPPKWFFANALSRTLEPFALRNVAHITGVSAGTTSGVIQRYKWLTKDDATEIPYGAEADDFKYLRQQPRRNTIFDQEDGLAHLSYVGACIPAMHDSVRALFSAVRMGLECAPEKFLRLRLHFIGTSYSNGNERRDVMKLAQESGIEGYVDERPGRIPYLESLQVMLDSKALFLLGSDEPHYTASKTFPYILAERPLLAIFHEESSVVRILHETGAGEVVTFNAARNPTDSVVEIYEQLSTLTSRSYKMNTNWDAFGSYTTEAMSKRLADVFDRELRRLERAEVINQPKIGEANIRIWK